MSLIFTKMAERKIPIDMVVQDVGQGGRAEVSFTVPQDDLADTLTAAQQAVDELGAGRVQHGTNVVEDLRRRPGHADAHGRGRPDVSLAGRRGHQHRHDHDERNQDFDARQPRPVRRGGRSRARGFRPARRACDGPVGRLSASAAGQAPARGPDLEREVVAQLASMEDIVVSEVCLDTAQARVTIRNLPDMPGVAADVFSAVAEGGVMVDMIVQNVSHSGRASLSFTVPRPDLEQCLLLLREVIGTLAGGRIELRRGHGEALGRGNRPADAHRGRREDVPGTGRRGNQRAAHQHQRNPHLRRRRRRAGPGRPGPAEPGVRPLNALNLGFDRSPTEAFERSEIAGKRSAPHDKLRNLR